jgi:hypothetical protein
MKISGKTRSRAALAAGILTTLGLLVLAFATAAFASLGGDESSVQNDRLQMKAAKPAAVQATQNYSVHEITTPYGTVVREFVSPDGKVFGVAWRGPFLPDFQQILGSYYDQFTQAAQSKRASQPRTITARRAPLSINQPGLVVNSTGHLRFYAGQAYIPEALPSGVSSADIK